MPSCRITKLAVPIVVMLIVAITTKPAPSSPPIQITDIIGLTNALTVRPTEGAGYATGRAAIINASGQVDGAAGNLGDCVHVDGGTGACGSSGSSTANFADSETPAGTLNGVNQTFTLQGSPVPSSSLHLFANGIRLSTGGDYTITGNRINFTGLYVPGVGDTLLADYRF